MMIAVFNLHDMDIGPLIMVEARDLVWVLFASMFWASLAILLLGVVEAKGIVNLLRIPFPMLAPVILVFATIGAFALRSNIIDIYTMFIAGVLGYVLRKRDYSIPALVMGVILGKIGEENFALSLVLMDYNFFQFFTSPISAVLISIGILTIVMNLIRHRKMFGSKYAEFEGENQ